jgi:small subunit ribosomal protein S17
MTDNEQAGTADTQDESSVAGTGSSEEAPAPVVAAPVAEDAPVVPAAPAPVATAPAPAAPVEAGRRARKVREGTVISDKMQSTVIVAVIERVRHARYGKTVQRTKKLYAHDDRFEARTGDRVRVAETRPLSKLKRWRVTEVVERAR